MDYHLIKKVLTKNECKYLINKINNNNLKKSECYNRKTNKMELIEKKRLSKFIRIKDDIIHKIFDRLKNIINKDFKDKNIESQNILLLNKINNLKLLDNSFRLIKYEDNGYFKPHTDMIFEKTIDNIKYRGVYNIIVYLNESYQRGKTIFINNKQKTFYPINSQTGDILLFNPKLLHEGDNVIGKKYILLNQIYRKVS